MYEDASATRPMLPYLTRPVSLSRNLVRAYDRWPKRASSTAAPTGAPTPTGSGGDIREAQRLADHEDPRTTSRHYDLSKRNHDTHPVHISSARLTA